MGLIESNDSIDDRVASWPNFYSQPETFFQ